MPSSRLRAALTGTTVVLLLLAAFAVSACGAGDTSAPTAADYGGSWVRTLSAGFGSEWLVATAHGDTVTLRWESGSSSPVEQAATIADDGTLAAAAVSAPLGALEDDRPDYTGRLLPDGSLELTTTTHVSGVDAAVPVTLRFARGSEEAHAAFVATTSANLEQQAIDDDFQQALHTIGHGIQLWADGHGGKMPPPSEVRPGGAVEKELAAEGTPWPNLASGQPLVPGTDRGEYVYRPRAQGYRLSYTSPTGEQGSVSWATSTP